MRIKITENLYYYPRYRTITEENSDYANPRTIEVVKDLSKTEQSSVEVLNPNFSKAAEILLTDECNLECKYCYSGEYRSKQKMSKEYVREIVKHLFKNAKYSKLMGSSQETVYILFHGGGEPTLAWDELVEAITYSTELSRIHKIKLKLRLATNGMISKERIKYLLDMNVEFRVSLDGIRKVNDQTRVGKNNQSVFNVVADNIDIINSHNNKFFIASVVTGDNYNQMTMMTKYCIERWPNIHDIRFFMLEDTLLVRSNGVKPIAMVRYEIEKNKCIEILLDCKIGKYKEYRNITDYYIKNFSYPCMPSLLHMPVFNCDNNILRCNAHVFNNDALIGVYNGKIQMSEEKYIELHNRLPRINLGCENCISQNNCEFALKYCVDPISHPVDYCSYKKAFFKGILINKYEEAKMMKEYLEINNFGIKGIINW